MKKKKEIEIPKNKYIYQRYNGIITKYIVDKEYYIAVGTGIATKKDETVLLGKVAENIIDLIEVGDYVNGERILDITGDYMHTNETNHNKFYLEKHIKTILTKELYQANWYTVERKE